MKVYISVDMEGIAGVSHPNPTGRADAGYPAAVDLMVGEANAAIEGALAGGADEILLNDSHGGMYNLRPADLHPAARVLQGQKAWSMVAGAGPDVGFDVALFVGYHARAGHPTGTIAHTFSGRPTLTQLNGRLVGETGLNAAVLGAWGIGADHRQDRVRWECRRIVPPDVRPRPHPKRRRARRATSGRGGAPAARRRSAGHRRGRLSQRDCRRLRRDRPRRRAGR